MANGKCFRHIVNGLEEQHSARLMERARTANRLAKALTGSSRRKAYAVKHRALARLVERFPHKTYICEDIRRPEFLVVGLSAKRCGLHIPAQLVPW